MTSIKRWGGVNTGGGIRALERKEGVSEVYRRPRWGIYPRCVCSKGTKRREMPRGRGKYQTSSPMLVYERRQFPTTGGGMD